MSDLTEFKRLNFFTGFFTTAEDWNKGQEYHLEKRKLHNRGLHTPGVVPGVGQELRVEAAGGLNVRVLPGTGLDGEGNDISLDRERVLEIRLDDYTLPRLVYVSIEYDEQLTDYVQNVEALEFSGYTRVTEIPRLRITADLPNNQAALELARVDLQPDVSEIADPTDPDKPRGNEINRRHVPWAAAANVTELQRLSALEETLDRLHRYHLERRKRHNRGLHTPGVVPGVGHELWVEAFGGLDVQVLPGAALDGEGNEVYLEQERTLAIDLDDYTLPQQIYVAIRHPAGSGGHLAQGDDITEVPRLKIMTTAPDNQPWLELARIDLQSDVAEVANPVNPDNPQGNEIDRCHVIWAGSVGVAEKGLPPEDQERLILLGREGRRDFAALASRFPIPSADDVRHAALSAEMMARAGSLRSEQLAGVLVTLAAIEQDVAQEIGAAYPAVTALAEYQAYQDAVTALLEALREGQGLDTLFNRQDQVAETARELSEVVFQPPIADAGLNRTVAARGESAAVELDAGGSQAFGGREIARYRWDHKE